MSRKENSSERVRVAAMSSCKVLKDGESVKPLVFRSIKRAEHFGDRLSAIEREAYERGFSAGEKAGFELGKQKAETTFRALGQILKELEDLKRRLFEETEEEILKLTLAIARKVIDKELSVRDDIVKGAVSRAVELAGKASSMIVRLNPADMETIKSYVPELENKSLDKRRIVLLEDGTIGRGGCVVETENATIECTIEASLKEIEERLKDAASTDEG